MFGRLRVLIIAFGAVLQMVVMASSQLKTVLRLMMTGHLLWLYNPPWLAYSFYLCVRYCPSHIYRISIWLRPKVLFSITPSEKYHSISHMNYLFRWLCWSPSYLPSICIYAHFYDGLNWGLQSVLLPKASRIERSALLYSLICSFASFILWFPKECYQLSSLGLFTWMYHAAWGVNNDLLWSICM